MYAHVLNLGTNFIFNNEAFCPKCVHIMNNNLLIYFSVKETILCSLSYKKACIFKSLVKWL